MIELIALWLCRCVEACLMLGVWFHKWGVLGGLEISLSQCEISIQKDSFLRLKRTVRVERIDTRQYNRCLNHLMDTHQNNRSD